MSDVITESVRGVNIKFQTSPGVFSKGGLDAGSKLLLDHVEVTDHMLVADLGCGTGVIGLTVAKLNSRAHVHLFDVNLRTTNLAKANAELNKLPNVEVFLSDLFSAVPDRTYQLILSNPAQHLGTEFLEETASECFKHLKPKGEVLWVIQKHLAPVIERLFKKYFGSYEIVERKQEFVIIKAIRTH